MICRRPGPPKESKGGSSGALCSLAGSGGDSGTLQGGNPRPTAPLRATVRPTLSCWTGQRTPLEWRYSGGVLAPTVAGTGTPDDRTLALPVIVVTTGCRYVSVGGGAGHQSDAGRVRFARIGPKVPQREAPDQEAYPPGQRGCCLGGPSWWDWRNAGFDGPNPGRSWFRSRSAVRQGPQWAPRARGRWPPTVW